MDKSYLDNLKFPASFFEDEVREGFLVTSMMKRYWASQLKVLSFVVQICDKYNLKWYAEYGTLLGTVRHGGYIPWDDDFDICMMRDDWNRFFEVAKKELPESFQVLTLSNNEEYEELIGRVVNCNVIDFGPEHMEKYYGCPYTVGIDLFPLDGIYPDEDKEKDRVARTRKVLKALTLAELADVNNHELYLLLKEIEKENKVVLPLNDKLKNKLRLLAERLYSECDVTECGNVALMPFYIPNNDHIFPRKLYEDIVELPFENVYLNVNARYDELLDLEYGDFLRVNKSGGVHEYPVYSGQESILAEHIGRNPYRYTLDANELLRSVQRYIMRMTRTVDKDTLPNAESMAGGSCADSGAVIKKKAVFLPCKAKWWKTMEPLWKKYMDDPGYEVHVLSIFYYDSDYNGNIGERHDERALFPEYVQVEDCEKFDFETIHPEVIVTQVPYDGFSTFMTVHEFFYSGNLQHFTDELIYIPYFEADAPIEKGDKAWTALSVMVEQEAVVNADKVIVSSDAMRSFYVDKMIELCGDETRMYWEQKVESFEKSAETEDDSGRINNEDDKSDMNAWNQFLGKYAGRKTIIYYITIAFLLRDTGKSIGKIRRALDTFSDSGDKVCAIIVPQEQILNDLANIDEALWKQFTDLVEKIKTTDNCIYDEKGFSLGYMDKWSGYYGDASPLVRKCVQAGIPVMIENIDI
ncbi:LicD family protein [Butyrivibrio proteoclasticus B316]|uniref:LicD family protein n=1 Tax=Butyrivibrio proteoclasticus (strain ATCC 51982 / DSM 14932 / B316) TaxID=515622 RepID=E0S056_BUTPB|nr:LicD family protein [Butyrivibrio proteoclasticus]ADL33257.1 LicD family protein [Butyrivibrio proteoclasticus B316]